MKLSKRNILGVVDVFGNLNLEIDTGVEINA